MDFGVVCIAFLTIHYFGIPAGTPKVKTVCDFGVNDF